MTNAVGDKSIWSLSCSVIDNELSLLIIQTIDVHVQTDVAAINLVIVAPTFNRQSLHCWLHQGTYMFQFWLHVDAYSVRKL